MAKGRLRLYFYAWKNCSLFFYVWSVNNTYSLQPSGYNGELVDENMDNNAGAKFF